MEVHHPHSPTHKKKWTGYLLEFLMLFLAVFLGFVAENIREHVVEKNRANKLTSSLITDLSRDTTELNRLTAFEKLQGERIDSLIFFLKMPFDKIPQQSFYRCVKQVETSYSFAPANATINELKNAGYLRYFSKDRLSILLSEYDFLLKDNDGEDQIEMTLIYEKYYSLIIKVCDPVLFNLQILNKSPLPAITGISSIPNEELKQLQNLLTLMREVKNTHTNNYINLKNKAVEIINYLNQ